MAIAHKNKISEEAYRRILKEEFAAMLRAELQGNTLDEGFLDKLKGKGKKIGQAYLKMFNAYNDVFKSVYGFDATDEKAPDTPSPQEVGQELAQGDAEGADAMVGDFHQQLKKLQGNPEIADHAQEIVDKIMAKSQEVDAALDGGEAGEKTADTEPLLGLLDKVIDQWDTIQNKTKDGNLKKSMDYIEKVAMAEQKEKSQNG